jgi:hypothetical protein
MSGPERPAADRVILLASILLFCAIECVMFGPVVFLRSRILYERDLLIVWYPQAQSLIRCLRLGSWPLWDPWVGFGQPLLGLPDAQVAYPFGWLRWLLAPADYYALFVFSHFVLSGVGLFLFLRRLRLSPVACFLGSAVWILSGPLVSMVNLWHHFASATLAPWVLLAVAALLERADSRRVAFLGLAVGLQLLAGSAEMVALTHGIAVLFVLASLRGKEAAAGRAAVLRALVASWLLGLALAAAPWLPAADLARGSLRASLPEEQRVRWAVHPVQLVELLSPEPLQDLPLGFPLRRTLFGGQPLPFLASLYLGLGALLFVLAALARGPCSTRCWPWLVVGGGGLLVAAGPHLPLYGALVRLLPFLGMLRYPSKVMIAVALAWAVLAAIGADALGRPRPAGARLWKPAVGLYGGLLCALLVSGAYLVLWPPQATPELDGTARLKAAGAALILGGLLALLELVALLTRRAAALPLAAGLAVLELCAASRRVNHDAPRSLLALRPPVIDALQVTDRSRAYVYDYHMSSGNKPLQYLKREYPYPAAGAGNDAFLHQLAMYQYSPPPMAGRFGIEGSFDMDLRGLQPRLLSDLNEVLRAVEGKPLHAKLLRLGAVSRVSALHEQGFEDLELVGRIAGLVPDPIRVYRVPDPRPRAYAVGGARFATGPDEIREILKDDFDPRREVVVSGSGAGMDTGPFEGRASIVSFQPDRVVLGAEMNRQGWVVLVDAYDPGWKATVDGRDAELRRADGAFRAVAVPAGSHRVEMVYRPVSVRLGVLLSAGAVLLGLFLALRTPRP